MDRSAINNYYETEGVAMKIKEIFNRILFLCSVPKCVKCGAKLDYTDRGLCSACLSVYEEHKRRDCPKCARVLSRCSCSSDYLMSHSVKCVIKLFRYSKTEESMPSNYLIYSLKQDNREDVLSFLAEELATAIRNSLDLNSGKYIITSVPRRKKAIVNYGFDHAEILGRRVGSLLGLEYKALLKSKSKKPQKSVAGEARLYNAKFDYKTSEEIDLKGYTVILVDDIITTGASISSCATLIKGYRPKRIVAAVLGIAYKDKNPRQIFSALD